MAALGGGRHGPPPSTIAAVVRQRLRKSARLPAVARHLGVEGRRGAGTRALHALLHGAYTCHAAATAARSAGTTTAPAQGSIPRRWAPGIVIALCSRAMKFDRKKFFDGYT